MQSVIDANSALRRIDNGYRRRRALRPGAPKYNRASGSEDDLETGRKDTLLRCRHCGGLTWEGELDAHLLDVHGIADGDPQRHFELATTRDARAAAPTQAKAAEPDENDSESVPPQRKRLEPPGDSLAFVHECAMEMLCAVELHRLLDFVLSETQPQPDDEFWGQEVPLRTATIGLGPFREALPSPEEIKSTLSVEKMRELMEKVDAEVQDWASLVFEARGEFLRLQSDWIMATTVVATSSESPNIWVGPGDPPPGWPDVIVETKTKQVREEAARQIGRANESSVRTLLKNPRAVPVWVTFMEAMNSSKKKGG